MSGPRSGRDVAGAGALMLTAIVLCALVGLAIGSLIDAAGLLAALGAAVGLPVGFWVVYSRYRRI